jgi:hypothetical protein
VGTELALEECLYGSRFREVFKVIDIYSQVDWRFAFNEDTGKNTGIVGAGRESNVFKSGAKGSIIPMEWAAAQTIEIFIQEPQFAGFTKRAACRWFHDDNSVGGKDGMKEGVLTISLFFNSALFHSK